MNNSLIGASGIIKTYQDDRGHIVIDIDSTFKGQVSINTVGTIKVGDWQGNIIDPEFGGTGCDNKDSNLSLNGDVIIRCPIIITCNDEEREINLHVSKSGEIALKEDSLQLSNMLSELREEGIASFAYDNISPNRDLGDMTYHNGIFNQTLQIGKEDTYLAVENKIPVWKRHPKYLRYIKKDSNIFKNENLEFHGDGIIIGEEEGKTNITLHSTIDSIAILKRKGILTIDPQTGIIKTCYLDQGDGIWIEYPTGYPNRPWIEDHEEISYNPRISIAPYYQGQQSITTIGKIKTGEWEAKKIAPEFGGTGSSNQFNIEIGGELKTNCTLNIISHARAMGVNFISESGSFLELPRDGKVATEQNSLQVRNNLLDVGNTIEAFRNISPTEAKGDFIVRGPGDYDERLPMGKDGQILMANTKKNLGVEWIDLNLEEKIENIVENMLLDKTKQDEAKDKKKNDEHDCQLQKFINAIMSQLDHMARTNQIKLLSEMKSALQEWSRSIT